MQQTTTNNMPLHRLTVRRDNMYLDPQGMPRCSICHEELKETREMMGQLWEWRRPCRCQREEKAREEEVQRQYQQQMRLQRRRQLCFAEPAMLQQNFASDTTPDSQASRRARAWADAFDRHSQTGRGAVLLGPVGTGKTFLAAAVANCLVDRGYTVRMTTPGRYLRMMQAASFGEKSDLFDQYARCQLLVIDDLGTERDSTYAQDQLFELVDARYLGRRPTLVTTNLSWQQLTAPDSIERTRIFDRLLQNADIIALTGKSRRGCRGGS